MSAPAAAAPSGVVTFLFTDVEGSTRRWEKDAEGMRAALVVHDKVLRTAIYPGEVLRPCIRSLESHYKPVPLATVASQQAWTFE